MARAKSTGLVRAAKKTLRSVDKATRGERGGAPENTAPRSRSAKSSAATSNTAKPERGANAAAPSSATAARARAGAGAAQARRGRTAATTGASVARKGAAKAARKGSNTRAAAGRSQRADASAIAERLARAIPQATCELRFKTPFELLIATILSAQSTDKMVNGVMPKLLARYPTPHELARAEQEELEGIIKSTGFFRNKAKSIRGAAERLVEQHGGKVPRTLEEMVALPGVARKTANVVLGTAYGVASGFVVDTHVARVSQRLGLTVESDPVRIEQELSAQFPRESWVDMGHRLVLHGRYTCTARAPLCTRCPLNELCPSRLDEAAAPFTDRVEEEAARVARGFTASLPG